MRIGIDARSIATNYCGVSRFCVDFMRALSKIDQDNEYVIYTNYTRSLEIFKTNNFREKRVNIKRYSLKDHISFGKIVTGDALDVFHSCHSTFPLRLKSQAKKILTVHDVMAAKYSWFFERHGTIKKHLAKQYFKVIMQKSIELADVIVAVSEFTKQEILSTFHTSFQKVKVNHNGFSSKVPNNVKENIHISRRKLEKYSINRPYILYLGNFKKYKNISKLIEGFAKHKNNNTASDVILVIAGNDKKNTFRVENLIKKNNISHGVKVVGYIEEDDLPVIYANAKAFVFPSLYEGFGIPPLEAMASGIPVLSACSSSLPEVVGEAALMVNPDDSSDIANKIEAILFNYSLRQELVKKGSERIKLFNWERTAKAYLDIYSSLK